MHSNLHQGRDVRDILSGLPDHCKEQGPQVRVVVQEGELVTVVRRTGRRYFSTSDHLLFSFRKTQGYDSILQNLESALLEHSEKIKQDAMKDESEEDDGLEVQNVRELVQDEPYVSVESPVVDNKPMDDEDVEPAQKEDYSSIAADEAKGGLRGANDESEGSESVNDDVVTFEDETHEEEATGIQMEYDDSSLEIGENNDEEAFEL